VTMVVLPMTGPYDQHEKALSRLMELVGPRGIVQGAPFGIYYSDPSQVSPESLRWEVGVPVAAGTKVEGPFLVRNAAAMQAATVLCTGPFDKTEACFSTLLDWIAKNGYQVVGPAQEHWLSDVKTVKPEKRQTKIVMPIAPIARPVR
jgi:effector-binding domain-containing protein